jgi:hypothetical protein
VNPLPGTLPYEGVGEYDKGAYAAGGNGFPKPGDGELGNEGTPNGSWGTVEPLCDGDGERMYGEPVGCRYCELMLVPNPAERGVAEYDGPPSTAHPPPRRTLPDRDFRCPPDHFSRRPTLTPVAAIAISPSRELEPETIVTAREVMRMA